MSKLATQVVNKLTSQADNFAQATQDIKVLAEAVKCLREDMKSLKRKHKDQGEDLPAKRHADTQELTPSTSHLQTASDGTHTVHDTDSESSEDELDRPLDQAEETREEKPYAELEDFFQVDDGSQRTHCWNKQQSLKGYQDQKGGGKVSENYAKTPKTQKHREPSGSQGR